MANGQKKKQMKTLSRYYLAYKLSFCLVDLKKQINKMEIVTGSGGEAVI